MKKYYKILIILFLLTGSACTRQVTMHSMRPAQITVPQDIQTIVLVNRTKYKNKGIGIVEGVLTGEGIGEDENGVQEAMNAFQNGIMSSSRFEVKRATEVLEGNSLTGTFPEPMSWVEVHKLCQKYYADAVIAIELFDTDFIVTHGEKKTKKEQKGRDGETKEVEVTEYTAEGVANAKIGFRLYDPKSTSIADQQMFTKTNTWKTSAESLKEALAKLIEKSRATQYVSRMAGSSYAAKISPTPINITRTFYNKPKKNPYLVRGARYADVGKWKEAILVWKKGLALNPSNKAGGRMCYDIAVSYEVLGELDKAKDWAGRAFTDYGFKNARDYVNQLNYRQQNEAVLAEQMGEN